MKLPSDALIAPQKLTRYLLLPRPEDDKSAFLMLAGYTLGNPDRLQADIREQLLTKEAEYVETTEYGDIFQIRGPLIGPNGRVLRVVTIWMIEAATGKTKFVTLYPDKL